MSPEDFQKMVKNNPSLAKENPHLLTQQQVESLLDATDKVFTGLAGAVVSIAADTAKYIQGAVVTPCVEKQFTILVTPIGAPRMTRRDKWLKPRRPCVQAYFDYRAILQKAVGDLPTVPDRVELKAFIPMPPSWSKKKKVEMAGKPHRQKPDIDNICKGVFDSLFLEDGGVWSGEQFKRWCREGEQRVELKLIWY